MFGDIPRRREYAAWTGAGIPRWFFTMHALQRMAEMAVPRSDVLAALNEPEVSYPAQRGRHMAVRGSLAVLSAGEVIVTVLWHTSEIYYRAERPRALSARCLPPRRRHQLFNHPERKFPDESAA